MERVAVGSKDMALTRFELKKERMSRRNFILRSVCPGVSILSRFQSVQHHKVARATQTFFSNDVQLRSCHKCFSTTVSLPVFISLSNARRLYFSISYRLSTCTRWYELDNMKVRTNS